MPNLSTSYRQLVAAARASTLQLTRRALAELATEYARLVAVLIEEAERASPLRQDRLMQRSRAAGQALDRLRSRILALESDAERAARIMGDGHAAAVELAVADFSTGARAGRGVTVSASFDTVPERAVEALMRRRQLAQQAGLSSYSALFRSVADGATSGVLESIDRQLVQGVARGADSRTVARAIARELTDGKPGLRRAVERLSPSLRRTGATLTGPGEALSFETDELAEARGLLIRSRRIARSEILGAQLEADRLAQHLSPVVRATRWQLSGNHPPSGCECEVFARTDLYELGTGVFPTNAVPSRPHPNCGCVLVAVTRGPSEWDAPKPAAGRPAELVDYPFAHRTDGRPYTNAHRSRIRSSVNAALARAVEPTEVPAGPVLVQ